MVAFSDRCIKAAGSVWEREPEVDACAERFAVSGEAMHWRLYNFGLLTDARRS